MMITVLGLLSCGKPGDESESGSGSPVPQISSNISNLNINTFAEDEFGQIWIGTDRGLNRYSGKDYYQYFYGDDPRTINNNLVRNMLMTPEGEMWISTASGPARYTDQDDFHRVDVRAEVGFKTAAHLLYLPSGDIVMSNVYGNWFRYHEDLDAFLPLQSASGKEMPTAYGIFPGQGSTFWAATDAVYHVDCLGSALVLEYPYPDPDFRAYGTTMDSAGRLWSFGDANMFCFDTVSERFVALPASVMEWLSSPGGRNIQGIHSVEGYIILRDEQDCWFYSLSEETLVNQHDPEAPYSLPSFRATSFFLDSRGNLWVGSQGHGFQVCSGHQALFNGDRLTDGLEQVNVLSVDADETDGLWVVATENRLFYVDAAGGTIQVDNRPFLTRDASSNEIRVVVCDRQWNRVWIGTLRGIFLCSASKGKLTLIRHWGLDAALSTATLGDGGELYVGMSGGRVIMLRPEASGAPVNVARLGREIRDIARLRSGRYAILAMMNDVTIYDPVDGSIDTIVYRDQLGELFHLLDVCEDSLGDLWFVTQNFGLVTMSAADSSFRFVTGTSCETLQALEVDEQDRIWVSSAYGLNMVIPASGNVVSYFEKDGIGGNQFNVRASCRLSDGTLVFGGTHGLTTCHPIDVSDRQPVPLYFEDVHINGGIVSPGEGSAFTEPLQRNPRITLRHNENSISISFAALEYSSPLAVLYQYKMEGYDKNWTFLGNDNRAYFSSLPPGRYTFHVSARLYGDDPISASLPIRVKPALWASPGAWLFYLIALMSVVAFVIRGMRSRMKLHMQLEQTRREKEHEQIVNKVNMNFFADMAHEFRSPLTMIQGPMTQLLEDRSVAAEDHKLLHVMNLSVERMVKLVNQLLNFNKLDNDKLTLSVVRDCDIVALIRHTVEMSAPTAVRRGISIQTSGLETPFFMPLDPDKCESILSNLLSNALKYAGNDDDPGWIEIHFQTYEDRVVLHMDNNTRPFSGEELRQLFDRYYQVRDHAEHALLPGTGIGLNYAYMLALRMHGSLTAENLPDGSGVRFTLILPTGEEIFAPEEFVVRGPVRKKTVDSQMDVMPENDEPKAHTVLVVDDDVDIANYLSMLLSPYYNVLVANDAASADQLILSNEMPDLILSDVVMPGKDGISFCKSVKGNILTCHIPVILVTAKVGVSNEVQGLESGADAYVTKPFDPVYLLALIKSMLKNRSLLKGELSKSTSVAEIRSELLSPRDVEFLDQLYGIMEKEMANPELDIQKICDEMCVSRTKLFYKVKSLTGMSTGTIFKTFRLNMAAKLLQEGKDSISEVAYKVGFNSPSYFTRAFKAQFGMLPKDVPHA